MLLSNLLILFVTWMTKMSEKQIEIALKMIDRSQNELGHHFNLEDFEKLISVGRVTKNPASKEAQKIIADMVGQTEARI